MPQQPLASQLETYLKNALAPTHLRISDDTASHAHHKGFVLGKGHYSIDIASERFCGLSRIQQHQLVRKALAPLESQIHALALSTHAS